MIVDFRQDSVVTERINYDLLTTIRKIQSGELACPELLGSSVASKTKENIPTAFYKDAC